MTAVSLVLFEKKKDRWISPVVEHPIQGSSYSPVGSVKDIVSNEEVRHCPYGSVADIAAISALCNDAKIVGNDAAFKQKQGSKTKRKKKGSSEADKIYERVGEPTEGTETTGKHEELLLIHTEIAVVPATSLSSL